MKYFKLTTKSESGDTYYYYIEHPTKPTGTELKAFLMVNATDIEAGQLYENVEDITEIPNKFQTIPKN